MVLAFAAGATFILSGCGSSPEKKEDDAAKTEKDKKTELKNVNVDEAAKTKQVASEYLDNILLGMKDNNYKLFSRDMVDELKQDITKEKFALMVQKFKDEKGDISSKVYLGDLGKGYFKIYLLKASFVKPGKKDKKSPADKDILDDTLVRLILGKVDDKYLVFGFSFQ